MIAAAPWREAVMFRETWPHEYVLLTKDGRNKLFAHHIKCKDNLVQ